MTPGGSVLLPKIEIPRQLLVEDLEGQMAHGRIHVVQHREQDTTEVVIGQREGAYKQRLQRLQNPDGMLDWDVFRACLLQDIQRDVREDCQ